MPRKGPKTYAEYRAIKWEEQDRDTKVDWHASTLKDGKPLDGVYLRPKKVLFFKDTWHCPDLKTAKKVARDILQYGDVHYLELKGERWVFVDYRPDTHHELPGQEKDDRKRLRG